MNHKILLPLSILLLAACSKNDADLSSDFPIEFSPTALQTKALILPDGNDLEQLAFPTTETFNVFAFADLDGSGTAYSTNYTSPLMNDVNIAYQGSYWKASAGTYLWPATGSVDFYAYYPSSLTAAIVTETPVGLSLSGVNVGTSVGSQSDPLVASTLLQISSDKPVVQMVFKHITSQMAAMVHDGTTADALKGKIVIKNVTFKNMKASGDYRDGATPGSGSWSNYGEAVDYTLFSGSQTVPADEAYLAGEDLVASVSNSSAFLVIPSPFTDGAAAQSLDVTYSIDSYTLNGFTYPAVENATVSIPLYGKIDGNALRNGKRYVFHIGFSLDAAYNEIMFSPKVAGWETEDISGLLIDAMNAELI